MPEARKFMVGYRAYRIAPEGFKPPDLLAMGRMLIMASSPDAAMRLALRQVPTHVGQPGCSVGIRFVREAK